MSEKIVIDSELIEAQQLATRLSLFMEERGYKNWKVSGCASRHTVEQLEAEVAELRRRVEYIELCCDEGEKQLAASQLREQQLREACACADWNSLDLPEFTRVKLAAALRLPSDTTALEALIAKAGDVAIAKARQACIDLGAKGIDYFNYTAFVEAIRALPPITLKDLK